MDSKKQRENYKASEFPKKELKNLKGSMCVVEVKMSLIF